MSKRVIKKYNICMVMLLLFAVVSSCKTRYITTEVPVVVEHTSVQHHTDIVRDTLLMRDSVYHFVKGDTTIIERWHHSVKVERVLVADTIRDTIPQVVTQRIAEVREVNRLRWWQSALMWLGMAAMLLVGIWLAWLAWRVRK